jgi:hypothetical protein
MQQAGHVSVIPERSEQGGHRLEVELEVVAALLVDLPGMGLHRERERSGLHDRISHCRTPSARFAIAFPAAYGHWHQSPGITDTQTGHLFYARFVRILISTWPAHGHLLPLLPLARAAEKQGHEVVVASGAEGVAEAHRRGLRT